MAGNNAARLETKEQAWEQDQKTQQAWAPHPNVNMIRNRDCRVSEVASRPSQEVLF